MKRFSLFLTLSALALTSACSSGEGYAGADATTSATAEDAGASGSAEPETAKFTSDVKALAFDAVTQLPKAPADAEDQCGVAITAKSAAARAVTKAGWGITAEERIGRYQAVSFAGSFENGTSGSCYVSKGNVAVFEGDQLRAIAYARSGSEVTIGRIEPFGKTGLRIWDGDFLPHPVADIQVTETGLGIVKPAAREMTCGGVVPGIDGKPITKARAALIAAGWKPVDHGSADQRSDPREQDLVKLGAVEVDSCSGTGFGYCAFDYERAGARLSVTTVGDNEDPKVSDSGVKCAS